VINPAPNNQSKKNKPQETQNNETASTFNNIIEREVVVTDNKNININDNSNNIQTSSEKLNKTFIDKFFCCFTIFKKHFQITSNDFILRFINSFIPFNNKFGNLVKNNPDLYGPIWIYTSLIVLISATGSLTRTLQGHNNKNFFQEFIPIAGTTIYSVGFGLPILITFLMKLFGIKLGFVHVICTYGYSFSIYLPISIICLIQVNAVQWIALIYAVFSSTSLLVVNYYKLMGEFSKNKKYLIIGVVLLAQIGLLLFFKLYFFRKFSDEVMVENIESDTVNGNNEGENNDNYTNNNSTNITDFSNDIINLTEYIIESTILNDTSMNITINDANNI
jgi:hypothetical protein